MADEFIRVLRFDSVLIQDIAGEVIKIEGDNYTRLASCRCSQHMPIVRVRKLQTSNEILVVSYQAVRRRRKSL